MHTALTISQKTQASGSVIFAMATMRMCHMTMVL